MPATLCGQNEDHRQQCQKRPAPQPPRYRCDVRPESPRGVKISLDSAIAVIAGRFEGNHRRRRASRKTRCYPGLRGQAATNPRLTRGIVDVRPPDVQQCSRHAGALDRSPCAIAGPCPQKRNEIERPAGKLRYMGRIALGCGPGRNRENVGQ